MPGCLMGQNTKNEKMLKEEDRGSEGKRDM
jgi:hypothetical protein